MTAYEILEFCLVKCDFKTDIFILWKSESLVSNISSVLKLQDRSSRSQMFLQIIFLKPLQNSQENSYAEFSSRCFLVNFTKILRKPFLLDFDSANLLSA